MGIFSCGTVKCFNRKKVYGFIKVDGGNAGGNSDVYFNISTGRNFKSGDLEPIFGERFSDDVVPPHEGETMIFVSKIKKGKIYASLWGYKTDFDAVMEDIRRKQKELRVVSRNKDTLGILWRGRQFNTEAHEKLSQEGRWLECRQNEKQKWARITPPSHVINV